MSLCKPYSFSQKSLEDIEKFRISEYEKNDALLICAYMGNFEIAKYLVENGADVNYKKCEALKKAIMHNFVDIAELLYTKNASFTDPQSDFLKYTATCGHFNAVQFLLKNFTYDYVHLEKAFKHACMNGHVQIVKFLHQQYHIILDNESYSYLQFACEFNNLELAQYLLDQGMILYPKFLEQVVKKNYFEMVQFIVENGIESFKQSESQMAIFHSCVGFAANKGFLHIVKYLIEKGADPRYKNDYALLTACVFGHTQVVKFLLDYGCTHKDILNLAICHGRYYIVLLLQKYHFVPNEYDLLCASENGHFDILYFFVRQGYTSPKKDEKIISFFQKIENRAATKIYFWWIPICYDVNRECGKRMMEKSWKRVEQMYLNFQ